jgi:hypothetical protein
MKIQSDIQKIYLLMAFNNRRLPIVFDTTRTTTLSTIASYKEYSIASSQFQKRISLEQVLIIKRLSKILDFLTDPKRENLFQPARQIVMQVPYKVWWNEILAPSQLGHRILDEMTDELLIQSEAAQRNIYATSDVLENEMNIFCFRRLNHLGKGGSQQIKTQITEKLTLKLRFSKMLT